MKSLGKIIIDEGAAAALKEGKSLLPVGVTEVSGEFSRGDALSVYLADGREIARGVSSYSSVEARLVVGLNSADVERALGSKMRVALIHRDDLVV